jgi:Family of unknown function (DUF6455)
MVRPDELAGLARKGPQAARLLPKMLQALGVDPKELATENAIAMRDLQHICINCGNKRFCEHALAQGNAAENYWDFCPNALTLDALFKLNASPLWDGEG